MKNGAPPECPPRLGLHTDAVRILMSFKSRPPPVATLATLAAGIGTTASFRTAQCEHDRRHIGRHTRDMHPGNKARLSSACRRDRRLLPGRRRG